VRAYTHNVSDDVSNDCLKVASSCACMRVRQASRIITQMYDHMFEPIGLTGSQFSVLVAIGASPKGVSVGALAKRLVMDRTTLTRNLAPLERDGRVTTVADALDARSRQIALSPKGTKVLKAAFPRWQKAQKELERALGAPLEDLNTRLSAVAALERK
jgi:DNA-binding MarR family transcriptional regulator